MSSDARSEGPAEVTARPSNDSALSRRNLLLAGTSLVTAMAINTVDSIQVAQAQQPEQTSAPSGRKPTSSSSWATTSPIQHQRLHIRSDGLFGRRISIASPRKA